MFRKSTFPAFVVLYAFAALQFIRFYCKDTAFYLNMQAYLNGHERLPFQERVFPILFLKPLRDSAWIQHHLAHSQGAFTSDRGPFYLLSLVSFTVAALYAQRLYQLLTKRGSLNYLVFPIFLFTVMWTYSIHSEADFAYPYDLPSLAFFTAGLYYIYARRFLPLVAVVLIGTFNRETTLFLIGIYLIDAVTSGAPERGRAFHLRSIPWLRLVLLSAVWSVIKIALMRHFAGNDASESFLRARDNVHQLKPRLLPALLNLCGYTLPFVVLFRSLLEPRRFRSYLWILPVWFAVMFCSGVIVETRIYGELCSFSAIALVLIMEKAAETSMAAQAAENVKGSQPTSMPRT